METEKLTPFVVYATSVSEKV